MDIPISFREAQMIVFKNDDVTRRKGEDGGLLKQSNGSHGGTVGA